MNWMDETLNSVALPRVPVVEPWSISLAALIRQKREVPLLASKALGLLDRFGSVRLNELSVGFDDTDIRWVDVTELRTASLFDLVTVVAMDREVNRLRKFLPPVPGRKWIVTRAIRGLQALIRRAVLKDEESEGTLRIAAIIEYRGRFGRKIELRPGLAAASILAALPVVNESLIETAKKAGVRVTPLMSSAERLNKVSRQRKIEAIDAELKGLDQEPEPGLNEQGGRLQEVEPRESDDD